MQNIYTNYNVWWCVSGWIVRGAEGLAGVQRGRVHFIQNIYTNYNMWWCVSGWIVRGAEGLAGVQRGRVHFIQNIYTNYNMWWCVSGWIIRGAKGLAGVQHGRVHFIQNIYTNYNMWWCVSGWIVRGAEGLAGVQHGRVHFIQSIYTNYNVWWCVSGWIVRGAEGLAGVQRGRVHFIQSIYTNYNMCGDVFQGESFVVPRGSLVFSVVVYTCCSVLAVTLLMVRRRFRMFGQAELGGPLVSKVLTAMLFFAMWIFYILISAMKAQNIITVDIWISAFRDLGPSPSAERFYIPIPARNARSIIRQQTNDVQLSEIGPFRFNILILTLTVQIIIYEHMFLIF